MRRGIGSAMLFAVAAVVAVRAAWPGSPANSATPADRVGVITMLLLLAGLPLLARWFLGPPDNRAARWLRAGCYAGFLALIPAGTIVGQFKSALPRGGVDLRLYRFIAEWTNRNNHWGPEIVHLVVMALYVTAILWVTSRRARIAPATLAAGTGAGIALGLVMYTVAPLGLSSAATNPWLPGSDIDPLVLLAWLLVLGGPVTAAVIADRRFTASSGSPPAHARVRQMMAAGLLTSLSGALLVDVLGTGTIAVMLEAAWLRNWLYHGPRLLYGVQNLSSDLRTVPAIAYSHELTGAADADVLLLMCIVFPVIAFVVTACAAVGRTDAAAAGQAGPRGDGGGPPGPELAPDPPRGGQLTATDEDDGPADGWPGPGEPGPGREQDRLVTDLADALVQPAGMR